MYKSNLQQLCQKEKWPLPTYTVTRCGDDHCPRFLAYVVVNGVKFNGDDVSASSKDAQNKVAQVALDHIKLTPHPAPPPPPAVNQLSYKSQLQCYAQKCLTDLPKYTVARQGPSHALHFKAEVVVDGRTFQSTLWFKTLKEAENDAAKTALMFLPKEEDKIDTQDKIISYKNLLLELTQKERLGPPNYKTGSNGTSILPLFTSIVEVGDNGFFGEAAKSKKLAEMNAAKVAWLSLKQRCGANSVKASQLPSSTVQDHLEPIRSVSQVKVSNTVEISHATTTSKARVGLDDQQENEITSDKSSSALLSTLKIHNDPPKLNTEIQAGEVILGHSKLAAPSLPAQSVANATTDVGSSLPVDPAMASSCSNRVVVYPSTPDVVLPKSAIVLPFSDDIWTAVSMSESDYEAFDRGDAIAYDNNSHEEFNNECSEIIETSSLSKASSSSSESAANDIENLDIYPNSSPSDATHSMLCNKVVVYPKNSDVVLPEGASRLPFSDDNWVAVSYAI